MKPSLALLLLAFPFVSPHEADPGQSAKDPFPAATEGIQFPTQEASHWSLMDLIEEYGRVTNQSFLISTETRPNLEQTDVPTSGPLTIAPDQVHSVVETILVDSGYVLHIARESEPRVLSIRHQYGNSRNGLRANARFVPVGQIDGWRDHPAFIIHTIVHLEHADARSLSNSLRSMLTDANIQQVVWAGNMGSLVVTGFSPWVSDMVAMIQEIDQSEGERLAAIAARQAAAAEAEDPQEEN